MKGTETTNKQDVKREAFTSFSSLPNLTYALATEYLQVCFPCFCTISNPSLINEIEKNGNRAQKREKHSNLNFKKPQNDKTNFTNETTNKRQRKFRIKRCLSLHNARLKKKRGSHKKYSYIRRGDDEVNQSENERKGQKER